MSSSGLHILTWKSAPAYISAYMHTYTTGRETYMQRDRQTDTKRQSQRDTSTQKLYIFPSIHINFANNV